MGNGLEPKLDFNMGHATFDPILPHSLGDEKEVVVSNPCPFSVEMYSLEFDQQYLQEEEVSDLHFRIQMYYLAEFSAFAFKERKLFFQTFLFMGVEPGKWE